MPLQYNYYYDKVSEASLLIICYFNSFAEFPNCAGIHFNCLSLGKTYAYNWRMGRSCMGCHYVASRYNDYFVN